MLKKNKIKGNKEISSQELKSRLLQRPNRKFLGLPLYEWFYHTGENMYDTTKLKMKHERLEEKFDEKLKDTNKSDKKLARIEAKKNKRLEKVNKTIKEGNLLMRWGEQVEIYDSSRTEKSRQNLEMYLTSKGYLQGKVSYRENKKKKKVSVTYLVKEGPPHLIDTIFLNTHGDSTIYNLILKTKKNSQLKPGSNFDESQIDKEIARITDMLKDNGYFDFSRQFIVANVDTAWGNHQAAIELEIQRNQKGNKHKQFVIDSVIFVTDANIRNVDAKRNSRVYNRITYNFFEEKYNKKLIDRRVYLYPDNLYSKSKTQQTQRQLANLDIFKFINITYDTTGSKFITNIFTSPIEKFTTSNEVGFNVSQGIPGPFFRLSFRNRNAFKQLDILDINVGGGWEGLPSATDEEGRVYGNRELNASIALTFPTFLVPFLKIKPGATYSNPKTRIQLGHTFISRPEYRRNNTNGSFGYSWENRKKTLFNFTITEIAFINTTDISEDFFNRLLELEELGNLLINSFRPSFVTSMSFAATFNINDYTSYNQDATYNRIFLESGGTLHNVTGTEYLDNRDLESYQYIKFNNDFRKHYALGEYSNLAFRVNLGIAYSYGENGVLPYEKYFFAGGSNSVRAWRPRRLGPGSYAPIDSLGFVNDDIEQNGDILFESSVEFRRNLFGFVNGAIFLDFGNTWTIAEDASRPGAQFEFNDFYEEIAIGSGLGLRFDFSFLILRFDAGFKIYDPRRSSGSRFLWNDDFYGGAFVNENPVVYNIGIGYPF